MLYERLQKILLQIPRPPLKSVTNRPPSFFRKGKSQDTSLKKLVAKVIVNSTNSLQSDIEIISEVLLAIKKADLNSPLLELIRNAAIDAIADFEKLPGAHSFAVNKDETDLRKLLQDFLENLTNYAGKVVTIQSAESKQFHLSCFDKRVHSANADSQRHEESYKTQFAKDAPRGYYLLHSPKSQRSLQMETSSDLNELELHPTLQLLMMKHASQTDKSVSNIYDFYYDFVTEMHKKGVYFDIGTNKDGKQKRDFTLLKYSEYSAQIILTAHINSCQIDNGDGSEPSVRVARNGEHLLTVEIVLDISSYDLGKTYQIGLERFNYFAFDEVLAEKIAAVNQLEPHMVNQQQLGCGQ